MINFGLLYKNLDSDLDHGAFLVLRTPSWGGIYVCVAREKAEREIV